MKPQQVESQLIRVLSDTIGTLKDPRVPLIVTVEAVSLSSDYSHARVSISTIGDMSALLEALEDARGYLQRQLAQHIKLRRTPMLEFFAAEARTW